VEIRPAPTLGSIAAALLEHVVEEARADLRSEHPASAVELYFGPIGCQALPSDSITRGSCSIDGYYTSDVDPHQPWIFYADDVHTDRARFTIGHRDDSDSPDCFRSGCRSRVIARAASSPSQWDAIGASLGNFGTLDPRPRRLQMFA
jgi:hypothetical protein